MRCASLIIAAVVAILSVPIPAHAASAPGGVGIRLLDAPTSEANDPRAHTYIIDQLDPGTTITRHIRITNSTSHEAHVSVYPAAATIGNGRFQFAAGRDGNDLTSWTTVTPSTTMLDSGASADATVRIAVPRNANSGEQYAVIWAEVSSAPSAGAVRQVNRVGVRIYLDVSGKRQLSSFAIVGVTASRDPTGQPRVSAQVHNTGDRAVDVAGTVALSRGPGDVSTDPVRTDNTATIAPGGSEPVSASFDRRLTAGPWLATVQLTSGTIHEQATATITFPAVAARPTTVVVNSAHHHASSAWWWVLGAVALLLAGLAAAWLAMRARRARIMASAV